MPRNITYIGAFVKAYVQRPFGKEVNPNRWHREAKALEAEIKRHCDNFISTEIEFDTEESCEFCGCDWTEDDKSYNGGCCDEDVKAADPLGLPA